MITVSHHLNMEIVMPEIDDVTSQVTIPEDYAPLHRVLMLAFEQSAGGKGKERHAGGRPFLGQPIILIPKAIGGTEGLGGLVYQVCKKAGEAVGMAVRGQHAAARKEMLGAIVYAAAAYIYLEHLTAKAMADNDPIDSYRNPSAE
jgi:NADPH:quinone reductase-like Zn-dependent oxidoreductase